MPDLDVSFVLDDPMFNDPFTVTRRTETPGPKGRPVIGSELIPDLSGVITAENPADLMRTPEGQMMPRRIFCASRFIMRGPSTGYQADIINWDGARYLVQAVLNYSRYGEGFCEVIAETMAAIDAPPV